MKETKGNREEEEEQEDEEEGEEEEEEANSHASKSPCSTEKLYTQRTAQANNRVWFKQKTM